MKYRATCGFRAADKMPYTQFDVEAPSVELAKKLARAICISEGLPNPKTVKVVAK